MKIKKHLVAATLAVGLAGSAAAMAPVDTSPSAQAEAGWVIARYAFNDHGAAHAFFQGAGATAGGTLTAIAGAKVGAKFGAKIGLVVGGVGGLAIGAGIGAL